MAGYMPDSNGVARVRGEAVAPLHRWFWAGHRRSWGQLRVHASDAGAIQRANAASKSLRAVSVGTIQVTFGAI